MKKVRILLVHLLTVVFIFANASVFANDTDEEIAKAFGIDTASFAREDLAETVKVVVEKLRDGASYLSIDPNGPVLGSEGLLNRIRKALDERAGQLGIDTMMYKQNPMGLLGMVREVEGQIPKIAAELGVDIKDTPVHEQGRLVIGKLHEKAWQLGIDTMMYKQNPMGLLEVVRKVEQRK